MELVLQLGVLAVVVEAVVETLKMIYDKEDGINVDMIVALVVGVVIAVSVGLDIFEVLNISSTVPYVGIGLTGILISRGGNFVHELFNKLKTEK